MNGSIESIEATLAWPVALVDMLSLSFVLGHVPFAGHVGSIVRSLQGFCDRHGSMAEFTLIGGDARCRADAIDHVSDTSLMRIEPRKQ